jgi:hypothetical protein
MSEKVAKNVVASVLARLRNISKSTGAPFQQIGEDLLVNHFGKIVDDLRNFATPVLSALARREVLSAQWKAATTWVST